MTAQYFILPSILQSKTQDSFDQMIRKIDASAKSTSAEDIFSLTPDFQDPASPQKKALFTTSEDVLRMISHAISLTSRKSIFSYIGEAAALDPRMTYFSERTDDNIIFINYIAEQIHLTDSNIDHPYHLRLGALRQEISRTRLFLADSPFIFFNLNALKWSDAMAQDSSNASGITSEEANILAYMAGQSHKNKYFILYGLDFPERDPHDITLHTALQILWYYWYGATEKAQVWPVPEMQSRDFTIQSKMIDENLLFRKDQITGHWFHRIPFGLPEHLADLEWIASSHDEYKAAANEDIPLRIMSIYDRLHELANNS